MKKYLLAALFVSLSAFVMGQTVVVDGVGPDTNTNGPFKTLAAAINYFKGAGNTAATPNVINITYNDSSATQIIDRTLPDNLNAGTLKCTVTGIDGGLTIDGNPNSTPFRAVLVENDPAAGNYAGPLYPNQGLVTGGTAEADQNAAILIQNAGDVVIKNIILYPAANAPGDGLGGGAIGIIPAGNNTTSNVTIDNCTITNGTSGDAIAGYPAGPIMPGAPYPADAYYAPGSARFYGPGNIFIGPSLTSSEVLNVTVRDCDLIGNRSYNGHTVGGGIHSWANNGTIRFEGVVVQSVGAVSIWCENPAVVTSGLVSLPYSASVALTGSATRRSKIGYAGRSSGVVGYGAFAASDGIPVAEVADTDFYFVDGATAGPVDASHIYIANQATIKTIHNCRFMDDPTRPARSFFLNINTDTEFITTVYNNTFDDARGAADGDPSVLIGPDFDGNSEIVFFNNIFTGGLAAPNGGYPDGISIDSGATGKVRFLDNVLASTGTPADEYMNSPVFTDRSPDAETGTQTAAPNYIQRAADLDIMTVTTDYETSSLLKSQTTYVGQGFGGVDIVGWDTPAATSTAGVAPGSIDFGMVDPNSTAQQTFDVTATGGPVFITGFDVSGVGAADVTISSADLPIAVPDSGSATITVQWIPQSQFYPPSNPMNAMVSVLSISGNASPPTVALTGLSYPTVARTTWTLYE